MVRWGGSQGCGSTPPRSDDRTGNWISDGSSEPDVNTSSSSSAPPSGLQFKVKEKNGRPTGGRSVTSDVLE